jgi:hypothetical protein
MRRRKGRRASRQRSAANLRTALDIALRLYEQRGCIAFWNPRDITDENLRTDTPDAEALLIEPGNISSCEGTDGQYLIKDSILQAYESYPGHAGIDRVFKVLKGTRCGFMSTTVIEQCVKMRWIIMDAAEGEDGIFFKRYQPPREAR